MLACLSTVITTRSGGRPSLRPVPSMMRLLAWCGTSQSMSLAVRPGLLEDLADHRGHVDHGVLEDFLAFHAQQAGGAGRGRAAVDIEDVVLAAVGMQRMGEDAAIVRRALALARPCSTMAPAPSPNSTQVPRSFQSRMREKVSAPITSARRGDAVLDHAVGHRHARRRSPRTPPARRRRRPRVMPSAACTRVAVAGKVSSGVAVASTIRSRSAAFSPASVERALRGLDREVRGEFAVGRDVALADAGALLDPLVRGVDLSWRVRRW